MAQYHLRSLPSRHYAAMHAGEELNENEEFHDSFDFPQEAAPPGIRELKQTRRRRKRERHLKM